MRRVVQVVRPQLQGELLGLLTAVELHPFYRRVRAEERLGLSWALFLFGPPDDGPHDNLSFCSEEWWGFEVTK